MEKTPQQLRNRELSRVRSANHYLKNKQSISESNILKRTALKNTVVPTQIISVPISGKKRDYTESELIEFIKSLKQKPNTTSAYIGSIRRLFGLSDSIKYLSDIMKNPAKISDLVNESDFSPNTIVGMYKVILRLINPVDIDILNKLSNITPLQQQTISNTYKYLYEQQILLANESDLQKKSKIVLSSFQDLLSKALNRYGKYSKEYLLLLLYFHYPVRDNFKNLNIVFKKSDMNQTDNFIFYDTENNEIVLYINDYKTKSSYGGKVFIISDPELKELLNWRVNNLVKTKTLFGRTKLSPFIIETMSNLGFEETGINTLRKMAVSECMLDSECSINKRLEKASIMCHSLSTQHRYCIKN